MYQFYLNQQVGKSSFQCKLTSMPLESPWHAGEAIDWEVKKMSTVQKYKDLLCTPFTEDNCIIKTMVIGEYSSVSFSKCKYNPGLY